MDRFTWLVVGGVVSLVVAGLAVAILLRGREAPPDLNTPAGVVLAYARAEARGDPQTAWDLLAPSAQARGDHDRFLARAGSAGGGGDREYLTTEDVRIDANGASVVLVETSTGSGGLFGSSSYARRATVRLSREGADWRIVVPPDDYLLSATKP
ncbi:MAG TPA: hypothetical protein VKV73_00550 [Chloroflexota bacterium]|nr:hypothetical protein [Chloroflexota bacterium]